MELLSKKELKEILIKGWMTHDAMWFLHCLRKTGIETTNKINKAASAGLGLIEAKRFKRILNIDEIRTTDDLRKFIELIFHVIKAEFMKFSYKFINDNEMQCEMQECFAHDGIKRIEELKEQIQWLSVFHNTYNMNEFVAFMGFLNRDDYNKIKKPNDLFLEEYLFTGLRNPLGMSNIANYNQFICKSIKF